jgi:phosphoglycerate dehydrogenase-like enzyme
MKVVVATGMTLPDVSEADFDLIRRAAPGATVVVVNSRGELQEEIGDADVLLGLIDRQSFAKAERLRWVHAIASGIDMLLFPELVESDIILTGEKALVGEHLADHAFALLLAITRQLARAVREGPATWESRMAMRRAALELNGLTMGVVGFGGTGRAVARRARAFGMEVVAVDNESVPPTEEVREVWPMARFPELLRASDVVTICCPLTPQTRGMFNRDAFALMKPTAILVNVTRGAIVDGDDLVAALREHRIAAAGLDVVPEEPLPATSPLWSMANVVMTPHTAGASQNRAGRNLARFAANLERFLAGRPLEGVVDKLKGY